MAREQHFTTENDAAEMHRRSHDAAWRLRLATFLVSIVVGMGIVLVYHTRRVVPDELALGKTTVTRTAVYRGQRINAWRLSDYPVVYTVKPNASNDPEWLWLGNSQLHAINQASDDDQSAAYYASELAGFPVFALSLPNASLVEHLVITAWALPRRTPQWLIVPVVYDDLRNDEYRPGWEAILDTTLRASLGAIPEAAEFVAEFDRNVKPAGGDFQGTSRAAGGLLSISLQDVCENWLETRVADLWPVWRDRDQSYAALSNDIYRLRNWFFGITPQTKRAMIPLRYKKNMAALDAILRTAASRGVRALVYIVPLRNDVEPPYVVSEYQAWKKTIAELAASRNAEFVDIESLVPPAEWGTYGAEIDFMHFRVAGHRLMAEAIVKAIKNRAAQP